MKFMVGGLYVPIPELLTLVLALGISFGVWAAMRYTDLGKALRAMAEDGPIAAAFGINAKTLALVLAGGCAALAGVAGVCLALTFTLTPSQIFAWVGVVFAAVMLGGLGSALGPLAAGIVIGVSEAITMAVASPSWAPIVSFSLLILMLLFRPGAAR
jgi:branched-chain amino acid transport system permease protein